MPINFEALESGLLASILSDMEQARRSHVAYVRLADAWATRPPERLLVTLEDGTVTAGVHERGRLLVFVEDTHTDLRRVAVTTLSPGERRAFAVPPDAARLALAWIPSSCRRRELGALLERAEELWIRETRPLEVPKELLCGSGSSIRPSTS